MTNKKFKKAAMALALTACVAATPLAANAETSENAADVQAPAAVDHTEADTQEAPLPVEEEPEAQPAAEAAAQPAAPEATPIAVELPTAEETPEDEEAPEEKEETPVEVTPTEDAVVEKETPAKIAPAPAKVAPAPAKADVDNLIEDPDADIATMDGAENAVSKDEATITGGNSYSTLQDAINGAKDGDEVVLNKNTSGSINIAKWIKLNLNDHTINGDVKVDLSKKQDDAATTQDGETAADKNTVEITGGTITGSTDSGVTIKDAGQTNVLLKDLTIEKNEGKQGGGVHIENSQNVTIDHCTIQGNKTTEVGDGNLAHGHTASTGAGGGVYISNSNVTIKDSTIQSNTGTRGGGVYVEKGSTVDVKDSNIDNNRATETPTDSAKETPSGSSTSDPNEKPKTPHNNGLGGGIYSYDSTLTVTGSTISGNEAEGTTSPIRYNEKGELSYSALGQGGGGICAVGKESNVTLDRVTVTGNKATAFADNKFGTGGGIDAQGGSLTVKDSTISDNYARGNGGGIYSAKGNVLDVSGSTIQGNKGDNGGGIQLSASTATFTKTDILNNETTDSLGGGVYVGTQVNATLKDCTVAGNKVNKENGMGGGICAYGVGFDVTLDHVQVENNTANGVGGGICAYGFAANPGKITLKNGTTIKGNTAASGGGIYALGPMTILAENADVLNNSATGWAGGVFAYNGVTLKANNTKFQGNTAAAAGGILLYLNSSADLDNSEVSGNKATGNGGGVYVWDSTCSLTASNGTVFRENSAANGGGIYSNGGAVTAEDSTFEKNTATTHGGGFYLQGTKLTANRNTIASNSSKSGGGMYLDSTNAELTGNTIDGNKVTGSGGGIYAYGDTNNKGTNTITLKKNTITNNTAGSTGGGASFGNKNQKVTLEGDVIEDNSSSAYGGGIYAGSNCDLTMNGGSISRNNADKLGGGLSQYGGKSVILNDVTVQGNTAKSGAGIYVYANNGKLVLGSGTLVSGNTAQSFGGGIYCASKSIIDLMVGALYNNHAGTGGDDIHLATKSYATLILRPVGDDWTLDDCGHTINGWFIDAKDARWDADGEKKFVINLDDFTGDGYMIVKNPEDSSYTITLLDGTASLALKAAHDVIPEPTPEPEPDPEPTPTPGPVTPETPENPPVEDATPDEPAETPVTPENPETPPVQDATPDSTVAALPKTGVNWFTALAMALSGMALMAAGAFTSLFAKSKH